MENENEIKNQEINETQENSEQEQSELDNGNENQEPSTEDKLKETQDKLLRTLAEIENQRRRFEKETKEAFEYGGFNFARETLAVLDNLQRAYQSIKNDESLKDNKDLNKFLENIEIIEKDLISIFEKNNIKKIKCLNEKFDPNQHQAMLEIEDEKVEPGTILQEIQPGYFLKDRLLRPSFVAIATKKSAETEENSEQEQNELGGGNQNQEPSAEDKLKETQDKLLRTLAEIENQRRRFEKETKEAFEYGGFNFARETLAVLDNLQRAYQSIKNDETLKDNKDLNKFLENIEIIEKDLVSIFEKNNIKKIKCLNEKFDPNQHQAMLEIEDEKVEPGTILQEIQPGYFLKDRLLRPSFVAIAKKKITETDENKEKN